MPEIQNEGGINVPLTLSTAVEPAGLVRACLWASLDGVFFVACLLSTGEPMFLSFSFFSDYRAFEHRAPILPPSELHIPTLWSHGARHISPAMPSGRLLALAEERLQHKLGTEERDALCIFLRPGIQIPFRGYVCLIAPWKRNKTFLVALTSW